MAGLCGNCWTHRREKLQLLPNKQFLPVFFFSPIMETQYCISALIITHIFALASVLGSVFISGYYLTISSFAACITGTWSDLQFSVSDIGGEKHAQVKLVRDERKLKKMLLYLFKSSGFSTDGTVSSAKAAPLQS